MIALLGIALVVAVIVLFWGTDGFRHRTELEADYPLRYYELLRKNPLTEEERAELDVERCKGEKSLLDEIQQKYPNHYPELKKRYESICAGRL